MAATRIELPDQLEAYIQYKIETGLYSNGAEVIRDALRHMMQEDAEAARALRLREAVQLGFHQIERGEGAEWTPQLRAHQARSNETRPGRTEAQGRCPPLNCPSLAISGWLRKAIR